MAYQEPKVSGERQKVRPFANFAPQLPILDRAILITVAYADIFDFPRTIQEIHRFLVGFSVPMNEVSAALDHGGWISGYLNHVNGYITLPGRGEIIEIRNRRRAAAAELWPKAIQYGRRIARLPFVRMVSITGALSVENAEPGSDIDYLIVTQEGRLWLARAMTVALVRLAAMRGDFICPNYFLSQRSLLFSDRSLYTAHELTQMVPVTGESLYRHIRQLNTWTQTYLPNADGPPRPPPLETDPGRLKSLAESILRTPFGSLIEKYEMGRKIEKFTRQNTNQLESDFCADWCKGHFHNHGEKTLQALELRLRQIEKELR